MELLFSHALPLTPHGIIRRLGTFRILPVILSLQELKFILDPVTRFCHSEFKAWLTRLVGRLKDSHHINQTQLHPSRTKYVFQQTENETRANAAPAGNTANISGGHLSYSDIEVMAAGVLKGLQTPSR